jgi:hypothetical protein
MWQWRQRKAQLGVLLHAQKSVVEERTVDISQRHAKEVWRTRIARGRETTRPSTRTSFGSTLTLRVTFPPQGRRCANGAALTSTTGMITGCLGKLRESWATTSFSMMRPALHHKSDYKKIRRSQISIPDSDLLDLKRRLEQTRWTTPLHEAATT